jgi:hypothetical protein
MYRRRSASKRALAAQMARFAQRYHRSFSRFKVGEFWEKSTQMCLHFCERFCAIKDTKSSARILILSTNNERSGSIGIGVGKTTIGGTETVHRTATKIHRHHAKVEAIALAVSTKIRRETASVTDRERVIRFDE